MAVTYMNRKSWKVEGSTNGVRYGTVEVTINGETRVLPAEKTKTILRIDQGLYIYQEPAILTNRLRGPNGHEVYWRATNGKSTKAKNTLTFEPA